MILIQQNAKILGPFNPSEVKNMLLLQQVRSTDLFAWPGASLWLGHADFKPFLQLLADEETILYGDRDFIATRERLLLKTQIFRREEIEEIFLFIPEASRNANTEFTRRSLWWLAVLFSWTLVVPAAIWYINQKTPKEEGLGEVYGIRLTGSFGKEIIKDGMGLLSAEDPKRAELAELCQILKEWKAGHLSAPSYENAAQDNGLPV